MKSLWRAAALIESIPMHQVLVDRLGVLAMRLSPPQWYAVMFIVGMFGGLSKWEWCVHGQCSIAPGGSLVCASLCGIVSGLVCFRHIVDKQLRGKNTVRLVIESAYWLVVAGTSLMLGSLLGLIADAQSFISSTGTSAVLSLTIGLF